MLHITQLSQRLCPKQRNIERPRQRCLPFRVDTGGAQSYPASMQIDRAPRALCGLLGPLLLAGCASDSDFVLNLVPRTLNDQAPFASEPAVKLVLRYADGTTEISLLGNADGTLTAPNLPPLPAGTVVGLLAEESGAPDDQYDPNRLVAYGEIEIAVDLATGEQSIESQVLVPQFAAVGTMGTLSRTKSALFGAAAMVPGGDAFIFGGFKPSAFGVAASTAATSRILRLIDSDNGSQQFEESNTKLPDAGGSNKKAGMTATTVEVDGQSLIFVAGGRNDYNTTGENSVAAFLYDPVADAFVWGDGGGDAKMATGRSEHTALPMVNGSVLLFGGLTGEFGPPTEAPFEIFDPDLRAFTPGDRRLDVGHLGAAAASIGSDGVLICGGTINEGPIPPSLVDMWVPQDTCNIITLAGLVLPADPMPIPLAHHAMATLPSGRVLATGGITVPIAEFTQEPAVKSAFVWDPQTGWAQVNDMQSNRAHHAAIATPSGTIVIVGGTDDGGSIYPSPAASVGNAPECSESYDTDTKTFSSVGGSCTQVASGAGPSWSSVPGEGAFILAGYQLPGQDASGGDAYGILGFGPDL